MRVEWLRVRRVERFEELVERLRLVCGTRRGFGRAVGCRWGSLDLWRWIVGRRSLASSASLLRDSRGIRSTVRWSVDAWAFEVARSGQRWRQRSGVENVESRFRRGFLEGDQVSSKAARFFDVGAVAGLVGGSWWDVWLRACGATDLGETTSSRRDSASLRVLPPMAWSARCSVRSLKPFSLAFAEDCDHDSRGPSASAIFEPLAGVAAFFGLGAAWFGRRLETSSAEVVTARGCQRTMRGVERRRAVRSCRRGRGERAEVVFHGQEQVAAWGRRGRGRRSRRCGRRRRSPSSRRRGGSRAPAFLRRCVTARMAILRLAASSASGARTLRTIVWKWESLGPTKAFTGSTMISRQSGRRSSAAASLSRSWRRSVSSEAKKTLAGSAPWASRRGRMVSAMSSSAVRMSTEPGAGGRGWGRGRVGC